MGRPGGGSTATSGAGWGGWGAAGGNDSGWPMRRREGGRLETGPAGRLICRGRIKKKIQDPPGLLFLGVINPTSPELIDWSVFTPKHMLSFQPEACLVIGGGGFVVCGALTAPEGVIGKSLDRHPGPPSHSPLLDPPTKTHKRARVRTHVRTHAHTHTRVQTHAGGRGGQGWAVTHSTIAMAVVRRRDATPLGTHKAPICT